MGRLGCVSGGCRKRLRYWAYGTGMVRVAGVVRACFVVCREEKKDVKMR